jgi:hypothetical protein
MRKSTAKGETVAYSLSFQPLDFPDILSPAAASPLDFTRPPKKKPDWDDLYAN